MNISRLEFHAAHHWDNLTQVTHGLQMPLLVLVTVWYDYLSTLSSYRTSGLVWKNSGLRSSAPSLDTRYLPRNPVHPKTVTTCPVTALYPGGPWEIIGFFEGSVIRSW